MPSIACQNPSLTFMALTARACDYAVKELKKEIFRLKVRMRKLKMGMVGGGKNAFIGAIHRIAANIDGLIELHCGAFSSDSEISKESGKAFLPEENVTVPIKKCFLHESLLQKGTDGFCHYCNSNFAHFAPAMAA
jgi:hypothetical protein